ncbi:piggyBac transposable element-derived protein 4-like [Anthonomus grandis grandis]|uniref:piggyBac transposable element-derived protein 4-like n=1 Tax=Anthonomus grandis grandis TaxID=2921223 RepID=UPI0021669E42|nr:piggyBac transposable element-derived protein 4-like [Anthonomus grandis grandis]
MQIYTGVLDDLGGRGHAANVVLHLIRNYWDKGHSLYMDNYYNSVALARQLLEKNTYCTGTLQVGRKETPEDVSKAKLKPGESIHRYGGNVCVGKWKDKREVLYISTEHENTLEEVLSRFGTNNIKPAPIVQYNKYMSGIDLQDQMQSYYPGHRKTIRWYKKVGIHIMETMLYNSYMLYNKYSRPKMSFLEYRESIVEAMVPEIQAKEKPGQSKENQGFQHGPSKLEKGPGDRRLRKKCRWCSKRGIRRDTNFYCKSCPELPGLCLDPCFKEFQNNL